jgi:hypothetical protein
MLAPSPQARHELERYKLKLNKLARDSLLNVYVLCQYIIGCILQKTTVGDMVHLMTTKI